MGCQGAGGLHVRRLESGKHAKRPMFSVISHVPLAIRAGADGRRREHGIGCAGSSGKRKGAHASAEQTSSGHSQPLAFFLCLRHETRSARRKETRRFCRETLRASKIAHSRICPAFPGCEGSSNKHPIQNLSLSLCLRSLRVWRRRPLPQGKILA